MIKNQKGFTLLELVAVLSVAAILFGAIIALYGRTTNQGWVSKQSEQILSVLGQVNSIISLRGGLPAQATLASMGTFTNGTELGGYFGVNNQELNNLFYQCTAGTLTIVVTTTGAPNNNLIYGLREIINQRAGSFYTVSAVNGGTNTFAITRTVTCS